MDEFDVGIVGAGPAALSASIYLSRANVSNVVIGIPSKSGVWFAHDIQNYLGIESISGKQLLEKAITQAKKFNSEFVEDEVVNSAREKDGFILKTSSGKQFSCKKLLIATGKAYASSGVENEDKFKGKGVHYCVACDGFFYSGRKVAVIGSGNFAAEEALELTNYTKNVVIISNGLSFTFAPSFKKALDEKGIKTIEDSVDSFEGKESLEGLNLLENGRMQVDAVFVAIGMLSALDFAKKLGLEMKNDDLIADKLGKTSVKGIFAAGACCGGYSQVAKSVGDGCIAAITIIKELKGLDSYEDHT